MPDNATTYNLAAEKLTELLSSQEIRTFLGRDDEILYVLLPWKYMVLITLDDHCNDHYDVDGDSA